MREDELKRAITLIKAGNKNSGQKILIELVKKQPNNEAAWMWLAVCVTKEKDKKYCLNRVLEINPNNQRVRQALAQMDQPEILPSVEDMVQPKPPAANKNDKPPQPSDGVHIIQQTPQGDKSHSGNKQSLLSKWKSILIIGITIAIVACLLIIWLLKGVESPPAPTSVSQIDKSNTEYQVESTETSSDATATSPKPTNTPRKSNTPRPTNTSRPTNTPLPTSTPLPPTLTPEPIVISGSGQNVTEPFVVPSSVSIATFKHTGNSNFAVWAYGPEGEKELLVNTIGNYSGSRPILGGGEWFLEIDADGAWNVTIEAIQVDESVVDGLEGTGDYVSGLFFPSEGVRVPFEFVHNGRSNFVVWLYCAGGGDLLQNEIGSVSNVAVVEYMESPCLWVIEADGNWSIKPR